MRSRLRKRWMTMKYRGRDSRQKMVSFALSTNMMPSAITSDTMLLVIVEKAVLMKVWMAPASWMTRFTRLAVRSFS